MNYDVDKKTKMKREATIRLPALLFETTEVGSANFTFVSSTVSSYNLSSPTAEKESTSDASTSESR